MIPIRNSICMRQRHPCQFGIGLVVSRGFTLIELLVTICVVGMLLSIAVPNFRVMLANNKSTTLGNSFYSALQYARTEAIKRHARVSICPLDAAGTATTCGTDWSLGWVVVTDGAASDTDATVTITNVLSRMDKLSDGAVFNIGTTGFIRFTSSGVQGGSGTVSAKTAKIHYAGCKNKSKTEVEVSVVGMVSSKRSSCP